MAKSGELWDDSAFVKALDDAISKYKIMHGKGGDNGFLKEDKITKDTEESAPNAFNESNEAKSAHVDSDVAEKRNTREAADSSVTEKCTSEVVEQHVSPSNGDQVQDAQCTYVNAERAEQYNLLLNQYNAVEEQRQKLLEQLYQYGNWDSQGYSYGYSAAYDSQYNTVPAPQASAQPICCCQPYVCSYSSAPCTGNGIDHNGNSVSIEDNGFIRAAMGAVDKAIHSFNKETSEGKKGGEVEMHSLDVVQGKNSQTDLSVVLNAWFSAGFYTGKYLSEQASAKK